MSDQTPFRTPLIRSNYLFYLAGGWTALIFASLFWNGHRVHQSNMEKARIEAVTLYDIALAYRKWGIGHGNASPLSAAHAPDPYLDPAERETSTDKGKNLTLTAPAWVTREVVDSLGNHSSFPIVNHITSLKYINPANKPDAWEEKALHAFERGAPEISEVQLINGRPYLRMIKPFVTQESCLKCHGRQGYKPGDIRGGMSIAVPLQPHLNAEMNEKKTVAVTHAIFWCIGMAGIVAFVRKVQDDEQRLTESEEKYRLLFENNPHPMWVHDRETLAFLAVNDSAVQRYGYTREEFLSMTIKDISPAEDVSLPRPAGEDSRGAGQAGVRRHRLKDGTLIFVETTAHDVGFGGRGAALVLVHDVSERKRLEEQLRHFQKMEAVGLLAGGVAHDFNNILTAIIGYGSLIKLNLTDGDPLMHNVNEIMSSAERGAVLTKSLLTFSRKQIINPRVINLNSVVERVGKLLVRLIGEDIKLEITPGPEDVHVVADSGQMEQVLMNLSTNARDSMPDGGHLFIKTGTVQMDERFLLAHNYGKPGWYALIAISDTGAGMDTATASRIFEPFFTTKEMGRGTGLGLSIVYGIVKQHNGYINVYTEPGRGTTFRIYLPLAGDAAGKQDAAVPAVLIPPSRGTETILLAEDDGPLRRLVQSVLEQFGYRVIEAVDGEDALEKIRKHRDQIQFLLLDVIMPKKNGKEVYDEARKIIPGIRALFASGYTADIVHKKGILDEGLNFISKPVSSEELLRKVRQVLDQETA